MTVKIKNIYKVIMIVFKSIEDINYHRFRCL